LTYNVAASAQDDNKLVLTVGSPAAAPVNASLTGSAGETLAASRSNQIQLLFTSPACNPTGTLGTTKPTAVLALERQIEAVRSPNRRGGSSSELFLPERIGTSEIARQGRNIVPLPNTPVGPQLNPP
jgi:hypothetical protein